MTSRTVERVSASGAAAGAFPDSTSREGRENSWAVATAHPAATAAAGKMLAAGGNAVDAAVAAAWALSVCEPSGSGLGGLTTLLIRFPDGRTVVLDGHAPAPAAVTRKTVSREEQRRGHKACAVPSTPATLGAALERHGLLPATVVLSPAIELARDGFPVTRLLRRHIQWCREALSQSDFTSRRFLPDGRPPRRGETLRQPELARTLERLAVHGTDDFYLGETARLIARDMEEQGGLLGPGDLQATRLPVDRKPLSIFLRGHRVVSAPPPGGGVQLLAGLKILDRLGLPPDLSPEDWYEAVARVIRSVFLERDRWPIPTGTVPASLLAWLTGDERAAEIAAQIRGGHDISGPPKDEGPGDTTHLCVADRHGMVVALTQSVQSLFGAKVANRHLGFFYNNYLCTCPRYRHPSRLRGGAAPQSNAAPTLVLRPRADGGEETMLAIGAAGSRRITSSILQVTARVLLHGWSLTEAMSAPRIHATTSGRIMIERGAAVPQVLERLSQRFRAIQVKAARSYAMGGVQALGRGPSGEWTAAADPRREGTSHVG